MQGGGKAEPHRPVKLRRLLSGCRQVPDGAATAVGVKAHGRPDGDAANIDPPSIEVAPCAFCSAVTQMALTRLESLEPLGYDIEWAVISNEVSREDQPPGRASAPIGDAARRFQARHGLLQRDTRPTHAGRARRIRHFGASRLSVRADIQRVARPGH